MKRIVALFLSLVFGVLCLTGCTNNNEPFIQKSYTGTIEQISKISIDARDRKIEVTESLDNQFHISYFENSKEYYDISVSENQTLTMTAASDKEWTDYIGGAAAISSRKILLQIPSTPLISLKLSTTNEDISFLASTVIEDVLFFSQGGNVIFNNLNSEKSITISGKNGDISGSIVGSYDDFEILCDSKKGQSNLPSSKLNGTKLLTIKNNNGDINIDFVGSKKNQNKP